MTRWRGPMALAVILGVTAGSGLAAVDIRAEHYLDQGLYRIALDLWSQMLWRSLAAALGCAAAVNVVQFVLRRARPLEAGPIGSSADPSRQILYSISALCGVVAGFVLAGAAAIGLSRSPIPRPNILLIVLDTVRADRLSAYGYHRATTAEIDAFARDAIRFTRFYATSSWTIPSHASLVTGLYAAGHGATQETMRLGAEFATLAEILRNAGYQTWGASGNPYMGPLANLSQGFETFVETWRTDPGPRPGSAPHPANRAFSRFLEDVDPGRPFFAFVNYMDAHDPYATPEPYRSRYLKGGDDAARAIDLGRQGWVRHYRGPAYTESELAILSDLYDGSLAYLSSRVGQLLEMAEAKGLFDDTLILVTSDHGEHFGENGLVGHYFGLYNTTVRAPLVMRLPGGHRSGEVDDRKGQLLDLFPTILNAARVDAATFPHQGVDLLAPRGSSDRESIFSEYYYPVQVLELFTPDERRRGIETFAPHRRRLRAIERYGFRLIWSSNGKHELYQTAVDPGETRNLYDLEHRSDSADAFLALLMRELEGYVPGLSSDPPDDARGPKSPPTEIDDETLKALRALGYRRSTP